MSLLFKKGLQYPIEKLAFCKPFVGKCKGCSCPVYKSPVIQIKHENFQVLYYKEIDSHGNQHSCFAYKIEQVNDNDKSVSFSKNKEFHRTIEKEKEKEV